MIYIQAVKRRIEQLNDNPGRDRAGQVELEQALALLAAAPAAKKQQLRWMVEELRVSLFAQHLGTPEPISVQRIKKALS